MGDDNNNGEKVLLYVFVGIGLAALAYLFFKDQFKRDNTVQTQSVGYLSSSQLGLGNPRIDELEKQTVDLEIQTNMLKERLKLYDYKLSKFDNSLESSVPRNYTLSGMGNGPARAGSVMTVRTTNEDKVRQRDFGMN